MNFGDDYPCSHQLEIDELNRQLNQFRQERGTLLEMLADIVLEGQKLGVRGTMRRRILAIEIYFQSIHFDPEQISSEARLHRETEAKREQARELRAKAELLEREADSMKES